MLLIFGEGFGSCCFVMTVEEFEAPVANVEFPHFGGCKKEGLSADYGSCVWDCRGIGYCTLSWLC